MPGAQDRWDQLADPSVRSPERPTQLDAARPADRPERGSLADLRQRLERLPAGHPSSPYHDDLSRKPPAARLKDLELPLHIGERDANGAAKHHEEDPGGDPAPGGESGGSASLNGSGGAGHAPDPLTAGALSTDGLSASDPPVVPDRPVSPNRQVSPVGRLDPDDQLGSDDPVSPGDAFSPDGPTSPDDSFSPGEPFRPGDSPTPGDSFSASDPFSADYRIGGDDDADRDEEAAEGTGTFRWTSTDQVTGADAVAAAGWGSTDDVVSPADEVAAAGWGSTDDVVSPADEAGAWPGADHVTSTDDEVSGADAAGTVHWSSPDDLGNTAEWNRTAGWSSPPGWDRSADPDDAINPAWPDTGPAAGPDPGRRGDEPRSGRDGSWQWNGRYLTPDESQIADEAVNRCRTAEGRNVFGSYGRSGLTPAMRRLEAQLERGRLLPDTEGYALMPADLFKERLADLIQRHPDKSAEELAHEVHDGIRYAYIFENEDYADATLQVHSRLKGQGFELEARKNSWRSPEYKGINTRWRDPAHDMVFEVQFHTASSWEAKQRAQPSYEQIIDPGTSPAERARLRAAQAGRAAAIPVPPRCMAIPDYRKEGL